MQILALALSVTLWLCSSCQYVNNDLQNVLSSTYRRYHRYWNNAQYHMKLKPLNVPRGNRHYISQPIVYLNRQPIIKCRILNYNKSNLGKLFNIRFHGNQYAKYGIEPFHKNYLQNIINMEMNNCTLKRNGLYGTLANDLCPNYEDSLEAMEKLFYLVSFEALAGNNSEPCQENGISFVQSGLLLHLSLLALSTALDTLAANEINTFTQFQCSTEMKLSTIRKIIQSLPVSNKHLKLRWSSRLLLTQDFIDNNNGLANAADALHLRMHHLNHTHDFINIINAMVEEDSLGGFRNSFDKSDFAQKVEAVLVSTIYFRSQWRACPTLLNGSLPFYDRVPRSEHTLTRALRINDIVGYADLPEWDSEAVEIQYATEGLSLVAVIPRSSSLRALVDRIASDGQGLRRVTGRLRLRRVAVTMPVYTLRMTLLLPNKLRAMGLTQLLSNAENENNETVGDNLRLSHAVQQIMFWAEPGRNAYKDDGNITTLYALGGLQWDDTPDMELVIDRPYVFFVRWKGITLLNGNFVH